MNTQAAVEFEPDHTDIAWLTVPYLMLTLSYTTASANADTEDAEALLSFVSEHVGLLRTSRMSSTYYLRKLTEFPASKTLLIMHNICSLVSPQLINIAESTHFNYVVCI